MTTIVGGLRARFIHDNIYNLVKDGLTDIGWLDEDRQHLPILVRADQVDNDEKIEPNIVCVTTEDDSEIPMEMGSMLAEKRWTYYVDVYAENAALGLELSTDIEDILNGRFTQTVSRMGPNVSIYNLAVTASTPVEICTVEITNVDKNRARFFEKIWQKYWWVVSFEVLDEYDSEDD